MVGRCTDSERRRCDAEYSDGKLCRLAVFSIRSDESCIYGGNCVRDGEDAFERADHVRKIRITASVCRRHCGRDGIK